METSRKRKLVDYEDEAEPLVDYPDRPIPTRQAIDLTTEETSDWEEEQRQLETSLQTPLLEDVIKKVSKMRAVLVNGNLVVSKTEASFPVYQRWETNPITGERFFTTSRRTATGLASEKCYHPSKMFIVQFGRFPRIVSNACCVLDASSEVYWNMKDLEKAVGRYECVSRCLTEDEDSKCKKFYVGLSGVRKYATGTSVERILDRILKITAKRVESEQIAVEMERASYGAEIPREKAVNLIIRMSRLDTEELILERARVVFSVIRDVHGRLEGITPRLEMGIPMEAQIYVCTDVTKAVGLMG